MNETRNAIYEAFLKSYMNKNYEKITVKEICAESSISRTTFYSYYENIDDLKNEIEDSIIQGLSEIATNVDDLKVKDLYDFFEQTLLYIDSHRPFIYAFLFKQPNMSFMNKWKKGIKKHFRGYYPIMHVNNYGLVEEIIASSVMGGYIYWMEHPFEIDAKELNEITVRAIQAIDHII